MFKKHFWVLQEEAGETGGSAPAAPQADTPPVDDSTSDDSGIDWAELSNEVDEGAGEFVEEPTTSAPEAPVAETPIDVPPVEQPAAVQPPAQPEQLAPDQPPVQPTPEQAKQAEQQYIAQLERLYQFDEDTALKLQTEPEKVLPALAAKLHIDVMRTVLSQVQGMLPQVMQQQTVATERETKAKSMFFDAWPELKGYEKQVLDVGKMYRQMNPGATPDEAVRRIGEVAMTALGISRAAPAPQQAQQQSSSFRPAVPGRVNPPNAAPSLWDEMATDDD